MAKPNPIPDLKQRVKTLEGQVRLLLPLIEEVRVLKERLDSRSLHGLEAKKEEEKVGSSNNIEELKKNLKLRERELRETQTELEKLKEESEREKAELRKKYEREHQLRLQQEKSYQDQLGKLRQELEAGREMRLQLEESKEEALRALREELQAKGEELKKMADELQTERQKTAKHRCVAEVGPDLEQDSQGRTELHRAAERGDTHRVQLLLDAGSLVNTEDHYGRTPLRLAACEGHQDACRALLAAGAQPDVKGGPFGRTALHVAAYWGHPAVCELLLAAGARPNEPDDADQWTALHCAALCGRAPVVQLLLQHGAERGARDWHGRTALHLARENRRTEVAAMLQG
ncbi:ankyrin repeat domain-containing protein 23-like isoform X2 [Periplaneta americana]|uniref:ankyrin repeat domain-containing protein 23-like isoform X2 n=1 Tax=Periplaneta americana TaxID=6978 RepID=UPI0037E83CF3